jgi:acyl carrier protein
MRVVARVLDLPTVVPEANFFGLGGDSLQALEVMATLQEELGRDLPLELIYDHPVLDDLATALAWSAAGGAPADVQN